VSATVLIEPRSRADIEMRPSFRVRLYFEQTGGNRPY
jgi:hypothetical protein